MEPGPSLRSRVEVVRDAIAQVPRSIHAATAIEKQLDTLTNEIGELIETGDVAPHGSTGREAELFSAAAQLIRHPLLTQGGLSDSASDERLRWSVFSTVAEILFTIVEARKAR